MRWTPGPKQYIDEFRDEKRRMDTTAAAASYNAEKGKEHSERLEALRESGRAAMGTQVARAQFQRSGGKVRSGDTTSFGTVKKDRAALTDRRLENERILAEWRRSVVNPHQGIDISNVLAVRGAQTAISQFLVARVGGQEPGQQVALLRRVCRLHNHALLQASRKEIEDTKVALSKEPSLEGVDCKLLQQYVPNCASWRLVPAKGGLCMLHCDDDCVKLASARVNWMLRHREGLAKDILAAWALAHTLVEDRNQPRIGKLPPGYDGPGLCEKYGTCLCSGDGRLLYLAMRKFGKALTKICKRKTDLRRYLTVLGW